jgi:hypothetical protein
VKRKGMKNVKAIGRKIKDKRNLVKSNACKQGAVVIGRNHIQGVGARIQNDIYTPGDILLDIF